MYTHLRAHFCFPSHTFLSSPGDRASCRQTTTAQRSSGMSTFRSCLLEWEPSAGSLSQSEGIQSAPAVEYQAGCRRVSSRSTDTVDSSALFMGTAGADEMASHWGLDFSRPKLYRAWRTRDTFNNCLSSAKMTTRATTTRQVNLILYIWQDRLYLKAAHCTGVSKWKQLLENKVHIKRLLSAPLVCYQINKHRSQS